MTDRDATLAYLQSLDTEAVLAITTEALLTPREPESPPAPAKNNRKKKGSVAAVVAERQAQRVKAARK